MNIKKLKETKGFSLPEMLISVFVIAVVMAGGYAVLASGQSAWFTTDANIQLEENLRQALQKITRELGESGSDLNDVMQVTISDNVGVGGSDIIRFSIPILCEVGTSVITSTGDVANWGAGRTWGCTDSTCMDANNDCSNREYQFVEYRINNNNQLVRRVLDPLQTMVREDIFAHNITDFQANYLSAAQDVVHLEVTASRMSDLNRNVQATRRADVLLRNKNS